MSRQEEVKKMLEALKKKKVEYFDHYVITPEKQKEIWDKQDAAKELIEKLKREGKYTGNNSGDRHVERMV